MADDSYVELRCVKDASMSEVNFFEADAAELVVVCVEHIGTDCVMCGQMLQLLVANLPIQASCPAQPIQVSCQYDCQWIC